MRLRDLHAARIHLTLHRHTLLLLSITIVLAQLVGAWSLPHLLLTFKFTLSVVVIHSSVELLAGGEAIVNQDSTHVHSKTTVAAKSRVHSAAWHVEALHLNEILNLLLTLWVLLELTLDLLLRWVALLHLELHIVEDPIEVDWIKFDRHLDCRVLLEVHERLVALLARVHHASNAFDTFALFQSDLLSVEDHELDKTLNYDHPVVRLTRDWVVDQR